MCIEIVEYLPPREVPGREGTTGSVTKLLRRAGLPKPSLHVNFSNSRERESDCGCIFILSGSNYLAKELPA